MPATDRSVDVLLVGGGVASVRCARTLRRHGFDGSVLIVGDEDRPPYNRPPLSKELLRDDLPDELLAAEPASWYARRSIDLLTECAGHGHRPRRRPRQPCGWLEPYGSSGVCWPPVPRFGGSRSPARTRR